MTKLVLLRLDGDLASGVQVGLEVGEDGKQPELESSGRLPPQPRLLEYFTYWRHCYRQLPMPTRLRPKQVSYRDSVWSCIQACQTAADYLQRAMSNWLAAREFRSIKEDLLCELKRNDIVRVLIHTRDPLLAQLPWHLWDFFERYPNTELALSSPAAQRTRPVLAALPSGRVRILAILGNSAGINVATDRALLEQLPQAAVRFLVEPSRQDICDRLFEQTWDILFFAGHSESMEGSAAGDRGRIFINQTDSLAIADLRASLDKAVQRGLKLAILNSCNGLGLAQDLRPLHIPQLIVMREPVPDRVAQEFLKYFLSAFSRGTSLYLSVREARQRLAELERDFPCASWLPVIFQNRAEMPPSWAGLLGSEGLAGSASPRQSLPDQADSTLLAETPRPHGQHEGRYREQDREQEGQWRELLSPLLKPERRSPPAVDPPETHLLPLADAFSHPRQSSPEETLWDASIPGSTPGNSEWRTLSSTHLDALPPSTTVMQNLSHAAQPDQPTPPAAPLSPPQPAAPVSPPSMPVSPPVATPAATVPTAPERTSPKSGAPKTDSNFAGAKPAPGVEATPAPPTWRPEEVLPIGDGLGVGPVSDQGIVKEAIYPGYIGWVMHEGTRWKACLDLPWRQLYLPVDTPVRVLGRLDGTNILVVQPIRGAA